MRTRVDEISEAGVGEAKFKQVFHAQFLEYAIDELHGQLREQKTHGIG